MFLTARVLRYISFSDAASASAGGVASGVTGLGVSWTLGGRPRLGRESKELTLEGTFFFFLLPFPFVVDGLPFHSVSDLGVPVNLELRNEIGLVTSRKTPAIILPPFWVVFVE